jgi:outer membrane murein-binding lipoprotein Lpp
VHGGVSDARLDQLSHDCLDLSARAKRAAEASERKTRTWGLAVPVLVALVALAGVAFQTSHANDDEIKKLEQDVKTLQTKLDLEKRVAKLEAEK